jgi:hypothetical protein
VASMSEGCDAHDRGGNHDQDVAVALHALQDAPIDPASAGRRQPGEEQTMSRVHRRPAQFNQVAADITKTVCARWQNGSHRILSISREFGGMIETAEVHSSELAPSETQTDCSRRGQPKIKPSQIFSGARRGKRPEGGSA